MEQQRLNNAIQSYIITWKRSKITLYQLFPSTGGGLEEQGGGLEKQGGGQIDKWGGVTKKGGQKKGRGVKKKGGPFRNSERIAECARLVKEASTRGCGFTVLLSAAQVCEAFNGQV